VSGISTGMFVENCEWELYEYLFLLQTPAETL